mgnify:FL=1
MKKFLAMVLAIALLCSVTAFAHPFTDAAGHWAESDIDAAYGAKIISGDGNGLFRPDDSISRGEFLKMLVSVVCSEMNTEIPADFEDSAHWASKYYNFATNMLYTPLTETDAVDGAVPGLMDSASFDLPIQRWEMAYLLGNIVIPFTQYLDEEYKAPEYSDSAEVDKLPKAVSVCVNNCISAGLVKGDENGNFNPKNGGTRAEAAVLMNRCANVVKKAIENYNAAAEEAKKQAEAKLEASRITYDKIPTGHPVVTILMENNKTVKIELYPEYAPQTVANFVSLVKSGFYDGLTFHRIVEGFMAQGGDPNGDGTGGSEHTILGEFSANGFDKNTLKHEKGTVSMARSALVNSASSQFFICYGDASFLDGQYAAFGKVTEGMDAIEEFTKSEMKANAMGELASPVTPIVMKKVTVK